MAISTPPIPGLAYRNTGVDPNAISGIGDALIGGLDRRRQLGMERERKEAFAGGIPTRADGTPDYAAMASRLFQVGDTDTGMGLTRLAETSVQNEFLRGRPHEVGNRLVDPRTYDTLYEAPPEPKPPQIGTIYGDTGQPQTAIIQPDTAQFTPIGGEKAPTRPARTASDNKAIFEAEDANVNIKGTLEALRRAKDLNDSAFSGFGAGARAAMGSKLPDAVVPDWLADKQGADATTEWQKIMSPEALKMMADTLKGATTDFELRQYIDYLADPSTPPHIRKSIIDRLVNLAEAKEALNSQRIHELRGNMSESGDLTAGPALPGLPGQDQPPAGWTPEEWQMLSPEERASIGQ